MNKIKLFLEGLIIGFGKIIPGVSGSIFAMVFGVYELIVDCLSNPKNIIKQFDKVFPLGVGIVFAIFFGSNLIKYLFINYYVGSMSLFIGMMFYGIIPLIKDSYKTCFKLSDILISMIVVSIVSSLMLIDFDVNIISSQNMFREFISLFLCGILDAGSTIIPGISGSAILMMLGYYEIIISSLASVSFSSLKVLFPFLTGLGFGLVAIARMIKYLFNKHSNIMKLSIISFTSFSCLYLIISLLKIMDTSDILSSIFIFFIGFTLSYLIENKMN